MNMRTKAERILQELGYDFRTFTIEGFIHYIGQAKGREIITTPWSMPPTLFGAWMTDDEEPKEYVFYRDNVPLIHQIHIQLHEISHFLLGHPTLHINRKTIASVLEGTTSLPFVESPRLRSPRKADYEIQAETLANLIQKRVIQNSQLDQLLSDLSSEEKLAYFLKTMGLA